MKALKLPAYQTIVPNAVYGQKSEPLDLGSGPKDMVHTVILQQFTEPSQAKVFSFITDKAREVYALAHARGASEPSAPDHNVLSLLKLLPPSTLDYLMQRDKDVLSHLKDHYPSRQEQENRQYLQVTHGIIPESVLKEARGVGRQDYATAEAIDKQVLDEWKLLVRLQKNGAFPERQELRYLLDRGVRDSDVFRIQGNLENYQTAVAHMRLLYATLTSPEMIAGIWGDSPSVMEKKASSTVKELLMCLANKKIIQTLPEILAAIIQRIPDEGKPKKKDFN